MPFEEATSSPKEEKGEKVTVVGSFKIGHLLGKGSFCKVRLATHIVSGQQVCLIVLCISNSFIYLHSVKFAVKIIKAVNSIKWSDVEREISVLRKLNHPNIIKLHQVLYSGKLIFGSNSTRHDTHSLPYNYYYAMK
jgi:serine/threonine protein kinase